MDMERKSLLNSGQHQRTVHFATVRCWFSKVAISSRNVKPTLRNQNEHEVSCIFKNNRDRVVYIHHPTRPA